MAKNRIAPLSFQWQVVLHSCGFTCPDTLAPLGQTRPYILLACVKECKNTSKKVI